MRQDPAPLPGAPDLGPFRPPSTLEPEFHAPPPRPIPESLRRGRYEQTRRTGLYFGAFFAASALATWVLTRGTTLDSYFLALPWFHWLGAASALTTLAAAVAHRLMPGRYAYVRDGIPMPARVLDLRLVVAATANGAPSAYRYSCTIEYRPPEGGELRHAVVQSPEFSEMFKKSTETTLRVGDYATAVALPGRLDQTLALYGFLQLNPDVDFLRRRGRPPGSGHPVTAALLYVGLVYLFLGLLLAVTCLPSLLPLGLPESVDPRVAVPAAVLVALLGAGLTWRGIARSEGKRRAELEASNAAARREGLPLEEFAPVVSGRVYRVLLVVAGGFIPVMILALAFSAANALLDRSPSEYEPVSVVELATETTLFVFRSYEVRYQRADGGTAKVSVPVTELARFAATAAGQGALERRRGYFGWPWVRSVHPAVADEGGRLRALLPDGRTLDLDADDYVPWTGAGVRG